MTFYNRTTFKTTYVDYIILTAAIIVFLYSLFTIEIIETHSIWDPQGKPEIAYKIGVQIIIAPLVAIHRMFIILKGPEITRLKYLDKKLYIAILKSKICDKITEGKQLTKEWINKK